MRRGIVLHLLARGLMVLSRALRWITQPCFSDPPRQRAVGHVQANLVGQQFLHPHPVAVRTLEGLFEPGQDSGIARQRRCALAIFLAQNAAYRITRQSQQPTDLAQALALAFEQPHTIADLDRDHGGYIA
jgi:hypothetical protein